MSVTLAEGDGDGDTEVTAGGSVLAPLQPENAAAETIIKTAARTCSRDDMHASIGSSDLEGDFGIAGLRLSCIFRRAWKAVSSRYA
jgi:hypothetical protein